jgi:hypothetical protein
MPTILGTQREALISQLSREITRLGEVSGDLRSTLEAGTATADALNRMLHSLNQLTTQFTPSGPFPKSPLQPGGPPVDMRNLTEALHAATETARQLTLLTQQLNTAAPSVRSEMQGLVDNTIREVLLMVAALLFCTFGLALAYRAIVLRMQRHGA